MPNEPVTVQSLFGSQASETFGEVRWSFMFDGNSTLVLVMAPVVELVPVLRL